MPTTAPFNPPAADLPGKPVVPAWNAPPVTQEKQGIIGDFEYAKMAGVGAQNDVRTVSDDI